MKTFWNFYSVCAVALSVLLIPVSAWGFEDIIQVEVSWFQGFIANLIIFGLIAGAIEFGHRCYIELKGYWPVHESVPLFFGKNRRYFKWNS